VKPTWVFVAGTYRTASTTQYLITRDIVEETKNGIGIGYHTEGKLVDRDGPRSGRYVVCKVFVFLPVTSPHGKRFLEEKRLKAVCTVRDPRDTMVSIYTNAIRLGVVRDVGGRERKGDFNFVEHATIFFPEWLGRLTRWIDLGPEITYYSRFEDLTLNLFRETNQIARHLDIDLDEDLAHDIASRYTVQAQRARKRQLKAQRSRAPDEAKAEDPWLPSIPAINFGTSGLYRTWLSGPEASLVVEHNEEFMKRFGYIDD